MNPDILIRKRSHFALWRLTVTTPPPELVLGQLAPGAPVGLINESRIVLSQTDQFGDLWSVRASDCGLQDGTTYHYWFEVSDARPDHAGERVRITDPMAYVVDWRLRAPSVEGGGDRDGYPAAVLKYQDLQLLTCDPNGQSFVGLEGKRPTLPANSRLVIYEMPTAWSRIRSDGLKEYSTGTFRDVEALVDANATGANFRGLPILGQGHSYLADELGVNAVELLPPADSAYIRTWGYGTTNFCAPDFELGYPVDSSEPMPNRDLRNLVTACHDRGIRFFVDVVMGFAKNSPYLAAAADDFFIEDPGAHPDDPDAKTSRGTIRDSWGADLFRYESFHSGYDPLTGQDRSLSPAAQLMKAALVRWMNDFAVDGVRIDSVETVFSWDFLQQYRELAGQVWSEQTSLAPPDVENRFLVVGEELQEPTAILDQGRLQGLWHESFKRHIRCALLGEGIGGLDFEMTIRKALDCRSFGYHDLTQAIIYLTSHDVEGFRNERLFNFLVSNGVVDAARRVKLGFACLLTSVGVPQILAGDEFADQHDLFDHNGNVTDSSGKQVDPVNYSRLSEPWRAQIRDYVSRLVKFRTKSDALASNDIDVFHVDLNGKQVVAWRRGLDDTSPVVVVANFSDFTTPAVPGAEYVVPGWPASAPGSVWREVSQDRLVPAEWVGREPIYAWEAKVYTTT